MAAAVIDISKEDKSSTSRREDQGHSSRDASGNGTAGIRGSGETIQNHVFQEREIYLIRRSSHRGWIRGVEDQKRVSRLEWPVIIPMIFKGKMETLREDKKLLATTSEGRKYSIDIGKQFKEVVA